MNYMVCYDVPKGAERVRAKIALTCQNYGLMRIQYSFFWGTLTEAQVRELAVRCQHIAGDHPLDIRFIAVCSECFRKSYAYIKDLLTQTQDVVPLNSNAFMNVVTHTTFGWDMADRRAEKGAIYRPADIPPPIPPISANLESEPASSVEASTPAHDSDRTPQLENPPSAQISPLSMDPSSPPTTDLSSPPTTDLSSPPITDLPSPLIRDPLSVPTTEPLSPDAIAPNPLKTSKRKKAKKITESGQSSSRSPAPLENNPVHSDLSSLQPEDEAKFSEITLSFDLPEDLSQLTDAQIQELTGMEYNSSGRPLNSSPLNIQNEQQPPLTEPPIEDSSQTDNHTDNQVPRSVICRFDEWDQQGNAPALPSFQQDLDPMDQTGQQLSEPDSSSIPEGKRKRRKPEKMQTRIHRGAIDIDILFV